MRRKGKGGLSFCHFEKGCDRLVSEIGERMTGAEGMASIRDVAKEAGAGVGTVFRAMNNTSYVSPVDHPFFSCLVKNIEMELYRQGYNTMVYNAVGVSDREREYLDMLERNIVDGIITGSIKIKI